ncbi:hypothetical protein [Sphingobacterium thalpophilum]|uniref:hypothetical protein n=1 Tax=Sphingobacterium thalpophilum TaxID=259 RepID=UPI003C779AED
MKRFLIGSFLTIAFIGFCVLVSCEDKDGLGDPPDFNPGPHIVAQGGADTVIISKNDVDWRFLDLKINGKPVSFSDASIKVESKKISHDGSEFVYLIKGDWFTIEKVDNRKIHFSMESNKDDKNRSIDVTIHAGNGFRTISINQEAK